MNLSGMVNRYFSVVQSLQREKALLFVRQSRFVCFMCYFLSRDKILVLRNVNLICLPPVPTSNCYNLGGMAWPHTLYKVMQKMFRPVIFKYKKSFSSQGPICILSRVISMPDPKHTNDGLFNWDLRSCCTESAFRTGSSTFLLNHGWNQIWMIQLAPSHQHHSNWRHINLCSEMLCNYIQCNEIQHVIETHLTKQC